MLDAEGRGPVGPPVRCVCFAAGGNDKRLSRAGIELQRRMVKAADAGLTWAVDGTADRRGVCRMGDHLHAGGSEPSRSAGQ
jgi:hypothetical protein